MIRNNAGIGAGAGVVLAAFPSDRPAGFRVAAVETKRRHAERAVDIKPEVLTLEVQAADARRGFCTIDLCSRDVRNRTGRQNARRIDAQLRAIAERERVCSRRLDQKFGASADMHGESLVLPELIGHAPEATHLLRKAWR